MKKPNILILMTDQQRADCMGCAGHSLIQTPNMDRLAAEGMRLAQATTPAPLCMPARASFINGLYPHNHGIWGNRGQMPPADETFFQILQQNGYLTAHIGKSHYYPHARGKHMREHEDYMHERGLEYVHEITGPYATVNMASYMTDEWEKKGLWDVFKQDYKERTEERGAMVRPSPLSVEDFPDSYVGRKTVEFVESYGDQRPMCLFVGFGGPHDPWDAPGEYSTMYSPADMPPSIPVSQPTASLPDYVREKRDFNPRSSSVLNNIPAIQANYFGKVSLLDHWFGRILNAFEGRGWLDDLLVVFWSDHGEMLGDHGRIQKSVFFESSVRVPFILRWPGRIPANTVSDSLAETIDAFPTILEAVGAEPSHRCLGRSLWPVFRNSGHELREFQLSEVLFERAERRIMIRSTRHKYVVDGAGRGVMLYDLQQDPTEQHNLVGQDKAASLEQTMRDALLKRLVEAQYAM